jgi:hypothetical protein
MAYSSGCHHSNWAMLGFPVLNEAGEMIDQGGALVPMTELAIKDTWHVSGMQATASDTSSVTRCFPKKREVFDGRRCNSTRRLEQRSRFTNTTWRVLG